MTVKVRPYKRGGWEVDITLEFPGRPKIRERLKAPVTSKSAAKRWGEERERQLIQQAMNTDLGEDGNDRPDLAKKEVPTLAAFIPEYLDVYCKARRNRPSTMHRKRNNTRAHLIPQLGHKRLDKITARDILKLQASMEYMEAVSANMVLKLLQAILNAAVKLKVIPELPTEIEKLRVPERKMPFYDFAEYERLVAAAREIDPRVLVVTLLGGDAGLRRGEMMALEWSDIDLDRGRLTIARSVYRGEVTSTKGYRHRIVPLSDALRTALRELRVDGPRVLYSPKGKGKTAKACSIRNYLGEAQLAAGFRKRGPHILRHSFCSHLAMRGAPALAIQKLAGHQSIRTTERYMQLTDDALNASIGLLDRRPVWRHGGDDDPPPNRA